MSPYDTSKTFTVSGGDGMKYVYVRFKDGAGNVSDLAYDYSHVGYDTSDGWEYIVSTTEMP